MIPYHFKFWNYETTILFNFLNMVSKEDPFMIKIVIHNYQTTIIQIINQ